MRGPDYRIEGFEPASERVAYVFRSATLRDDMFTELAAHHTTDSTFLLLYDRAALWDALRPAEYVGMRIRRDSERGTFTIRHTRLPTVPVTQNWLISHGCPPEGIELGDVPGRRPADGLTARLEDMLRTHLGGRYALLDYHTRNPGSFTTGTEVSLLVQDGHPGSAERPYRIFLEETAPSFASYTVREGAFPSLGTAVAWLRDRDTPLPLAPESPSMLGRRTVAARARTTTHATADAQSPLPGTAPRPGAGPVRSRGLS